MKPNNDQPKLIFSGVFTGYLILILHLLLIVVLTMTVVFLKSIYDIRWLLLPVGLILIAASAWYFYRRIKSSNRKLMDMINDPALQGRSVEVSLLGGMATFKLGNDSEAPSHPRLVDAHGNDIKQLERPQQNQVASLTELKTLLDAELITKEEFLKLKKDTIEGHSES